uniref:Uncharacterized protein n=1 Tax=Plectus sambesii TaxID=2011161 RepID=A0A914UM56_9BILA
MFPSLYMCAYNVGSITTYKRLTAFVEEIYKIKFDIISIAETWLSGSKRADLPSGYIIYQSRKPQGKRTFAGVTFYMLSSLNKRMLGIIFMSTFM